MFIKLQFSKAYMRFWLVDFPLSTGQMSLPFSMVGLKPIWDFVRGTSRDQLLQFLWWCTQGHPDIQHPVASEKYCSDKFSFLKKKNNQTESTKRKMFFISCITKIWQLSPPSECCWMQTQWQLSKRLWLTTLLPDDEDEKSVQVGFHTVTEMLGNQQLCGNLRVFKTHKLKN